MIFPFMKRAFQTEENPLDLVLPVWLPYLVFLGLSLLLAVPIMRHVSYWGIRDWGYFLPRSMPPP